jgi:predicted MPP superfamily phosphohydrolase
MPPMSRRRALKTLALGTAAVGGGAAGYGFAVGRHELSVTRLPLAVSGLPHALAGLRIGLLTDVHRSIWVSHEDVSRAVTALMAEHPDLIVLGGDYVSWGTQDRTYVGPSAEALAPLSAPQGVFGVLGNHDDDHAVPAALGRIGVQMLKDARTRLTIRNETLDLIGIRFWTKRPTDVAAAARDAAPASILLAHDPRRLTEAAALGIPLVLSGHTHGGQVVLPVVGAIAAQKFPIVAGTGSQSRTTIFVSRGIGTVYVPVRINCPPEVAILTLQPSNPGEPAPRSSSTRSGRSGS